MSGKWERRSLENPSRIGGLGDRKRLAHSARFYLKSINMRVKKLPLHLMIGSLW